jgi:DUF1365 family protein
MNRWPDHIRGHTTHARRGAVGHVFRHSVDYVLIDPESRSGPWLFSRDRRNLASVRDRDHGGERGAGRGAVWAREVLAARGLDAAGYDRLMLLTQPAFLGYVFNPVSFWLAFSADALVAVIAEVNNTFGDRHSYFCARPGFAPIRPSDRMETTKVFHVSPFQDVAGTYRFAFDIGPDRISILIGLRNGSEALFATLAGPRRRLTSLSIIAASLRTPTGAVRTIALIHWQALRLYLKRALFRPRPQPPTEEVT